MKQENIVNEDASPGTTSSGHVAANYDRAQTMQRRDKPRDYDLHHSASAEREHRQHPENARRRELAAKARKNHEAAKKKLAAKKKGTLSRFKSFLAREQAEMTKVYKTPFKLNENFNMQDIVSRLKGIEHTSNPDPTVAYGVEDDNGNMMKITIKSDDAKDFEAALAAEMTNAQDYKKVTGDNKDMSMAELLFRLKDEFEIIDVQFPTIPKDAIYNADKVSYGAPSANPGGNAMGGGDPLGGDMDPLAAGDDAMGGDMGGDLGGEGGDMGDDLSAGGIPPAGEGDEMGGDALGGEGEDDLGLGDDEMADDESVQDFGNEMEPPADDETSLLKSVLNMLKADAEARTAEANAKAEEARALQAEYSVKAANAELSKQEELAQLEAKMAAQKDKEKEAKKMAQLARFRVNSSFGESAKRSFSEYLLVEYEDGDSVQMLQKKKASLRMRWAPVQGDDQETIRYKAQMGQLAVRGVDAEIRMAALTKKFREQKDLANKKQGQQNPQQNQQQNGQQNPQQNNGQQQNGQQNPQQNQQQNGNFQQ